jgi:hypothetical protein
MGIAVLDVALKDDFILHTTLVTSGLFFNLLCKRQFSKESKSYNDCRNTNALGVYMRMTRTLHMIEISNIKIR